jgi:hypothetical protein
MKIGVILYRSNCRRKNCTYFQQDSAPEHHRKFNMGAVVCFDEQITFIATFPSSWICVILVCGETWKTKFCKNNPYSLEALKNKTQNITQAKLHLMSQHFLCQFELCLGIVGHHISVAVVVWGKQSGFTDNIFSMDRTSGQIAW